jgi:hypothetical protein
VSRLGFEPRTRGLKVSVQAVHGDTQGAFTSMPRTALIHGLHHIPWDVTAVAVNVAVRLEGVEELEAIKSSSYRSEADAQDSANRSRG